MKEGFNTYFRQTVRPHIRNVKDARENVTYHFNSKFKDLDNNRIYYDKDDELGNDDFDIIVNLFKKGRVKGCFELSFHFIPSTTDYSQKFTIYLDILGGKKLQSKV